MSHENVVRLEEIVTSSSSGDGAAAAGIPTSIYMVFEYCEGDLLDVLKGVREGRVRLTQDHLRSFTKQLLEGIFYIHTNRILHRDIKAANIFVTRDCRLKIGDWGLGRSWRPPSLPTAGGGANDKPARYTDNVVTLWYRAPELLMGVANYTTAIDIWSIGCLVAEMFLLRTLFQGRDELEQMNLIFNVCGTPCPENWPDLEQHRRQSGQMQAFPTRPRRLKLELAGSPGGAEGNDLVDKLLTLDPAQRFTAQEALDHDYLWVEEVKDAKDLSPLYLRKPALGKP